MWWYIAFSIIFTIYAVDLVFLFVASLFATVTEYFVPPLSTAATRAHKQHQKRNAAKQQQQAAVSKAQVEASKDVAGGGKGDLSIVVDTRAHQVRQTAVVVSSGRQGVCWGWCCCSNSSVCVSSAACIRLPITTSAACSPAKLMQGQETWQQLRQPRIQAAWLFQRAHIISSSNQRNSVRVVVC